MNSVMCEQGLGLTCMYCGDGINDLVALASSDVDMAVGSGHASAAAHISDRHASVASTSYSHQPVQIKSKDMQSSTAVSERIAIQCFQHGVEAVCTILPHIAGVGCLRA